MTVDLERQGRAEVRRQSGFGWEKFRASWREANGSLVLAPSRWTAERAWDDVPEDAKKEKST